MSILWSRAQSLQPSLQEEYGSICPFCGAENEKDAQYCISCGSDMWNLKQKQISQSGSRKAGIVAIVLVAVAVIVAIGAWIFLHKDTEKKEDTPVKETVSTTEKQPEKIQRLRKKISTENYSPICRHTFKAAVLAVPYLYTTQI